MSDYHAKLDAAHVDLENVIRQYNHSCKELSQCSQITDIPALRSALANTRSELRYISDMLLEILHELK